MLATAAALSSTLGWLRLLLTLARLPAPLPAPAGLVVGSQQSVEEAQQSTEQKN